MNTQRTIELVIGQIGLDNLKYQGELEQALNSDKYTNSDDQVSAIKHILSSIVINEATMAKFRSYITQPSTPPSPPANNETTQQ